MHRMAVFIGSPDPSWSRSNGSLAPAPVLSKVEWMCEVAIEGRELMRGCNLRSQIGSDTTKTPVWQRHTGVL